ncbi:MAG: porin [Lautropia sp.]
MKKSLVALAVAAALPAFAQAQTNVQLTGSIDLALESVNKDANGGVSDMKLTQGINAGSRFAIVGSEDLGGGLRALFNMEHRISPDTGTITTPAPATGPTAGLGPVFWAGQAWVGLGGGFGTVRMGRQYTPVFRAMIVNDVSGYLYYNNSVGLAGTSVRFDNAIEYESPNIGGLVLRGTYAAGEDYSSGATGTGSTVPSNKTGDKLGVSANGAFGPIGFGIGYHTIDRGAGPLSNTKELAGGLNGKFGNFGLGLNYAQTEIDTGTVKAKRKGMYVGASAGLGAGTLFLVLKRDDPYGPTNTNNGIGVTYQHGLSKRTFLYASAGMNKVERAGQSDLKPRNIALGMRHFF